VRRTICWRARCGRCGEGRNGRAVLLEGCEVSDGALKAVHESKGTAGVDLAAGEGDDDLGERRLEGLAILDRLDVEGVAGVEDLVRPGMAAAFLLAAVVIAEGAIFQGDGAAALAGGLEMGAEGYGHHPVFLFSGGAFGA
jgi:hypothetical protein